MIASLNTHPENKTNYCSDNKEVEKSSSSKEKEEGVDPVTDYIWYN